MFVFRQASLDDLGPLLALEERAFDRPWPAGAFEGELTAPHAELWLAFFAADGEAAGPIGYVDFWVVAGEVSLLNVAVDPSARRRGLALSLVALMEERGAARGGLDVFLEVRRSNTAGLALYRRVGFDQIGIRKGYYSDNGEDAIVMSKRLDVSRPLG